MKRIIILSLLFLAVCLIIIPFALWVVLKNNPAEKSTSAQIRRDIAEDGKTVFPPPEKFSNPSLSPLRKADAGIGGSIYLESISSPLPEQVMLPEIELLADGLGLLENRNWDGMSDMGLDFGDFDANRWLSFKRDEKEKQDGLKINPQLYEIYNSPAAQFQIKSLVSQIRKEYLEALKQKGVNSKYINELSSHVLPDDDSRYFFNFSNEPDVPPTQVEAYRGGGSVDYASMQMQVTTIDFHNAARIFRGSGILGVSASSPLENMDTEKKLRDMGMRFYVYHEMTHALQRAYANLNVDDEYKNSNIFFADTGHTLMTVDDSNFWRWGNPSSSDALSENFDISSESQAEGIAFELLTDVYGMSHQQKMAAWNHLFGRLDNCRKKLEYIRRVYETKYPDSNPKYLPDKIKVDSFPTDEDRMLFRRFILKGSNLPVYAGYFSPMKEADTPKFWAKLAI